jgi:hypothetical protein
MAAARTCNDCGHTQMIGYDPVDGRLQWWTQCDACGRGNFQAPIDQRTLDVLARVSAGQRTVPTAASGSRHQLER